MEWLVTFPAGANAGDVAEKLLNWGCSLHEQPSIPLSDNEQVIAVSGPADLADKATDDELVLSVYPNSEMELSGP